MKVVKIKTNLRKFFHQWVVIMSPLLKLSKAEQRLLSEFYYYRYMLIQEVGDIDKVHRLLFDYTMKAQIGKDLGISRSRINNILSLYRRRGILSQGLFNTNYIPLITVGSKEHTISYKFIIDGNEKRDNKTKSNKKIKKNS